DRFLTETPKLSPVACWIVLFCGRVHHLRLTGADLTAAESGRRVIHRHKPVRQAHLPPLLPPSIPFGSSTFFIRNVSAMNTIRSQQHYAPDFRNSLLSCEGARTVLDICSIDRRQVIPNQWHNLIHHLGSASLSWHGPA